VRKRTGLRNKWRRGKGVSTYGLHEKRKQSDTYGTWQQGKRVGLEVIAGRTMNYKVGMGS